MKKILSIVSIVLLLCMFLTSCGSSTKQEEEFYELVSETQELLDEYADDIYSCWYDYVYEEKYSDPNDAIMAATAMNSGNINSIVDNNETIKELYKKVKDGNLKSEIKDVMQAYNDYYSFVMEVSGTYDSFSAGKEPLKKELSGALKNLEFELD